MDSKIIGSRIKLLMDNSNIPATKLAKKLGINYRTLVRKLEGKSEFCNTDMIKLQEIFDLNLNLFANIFFNSNYDLEKELNNKKKIS